MCVYQDLLIAFSCSNQIIAEGTCVWEKDLTAISISIVHHGYYDCSPMDSCNEL